MKKVNIAELKNRLSHYLRFVRRGESVMVCDRDRVIARIDPVRHPSKGGDAAAWPHELVQAGILRAPSGKLERDWLRKRPRTKSNVVGALIDERESGR